VWIRLYLPFTGYFELLVAPGGGRGGEDPSSRRESTASQQSVSEADSAGQFSTKTCSLNFFITYGVENLFFWKIISDLLWLIARLFKRESHNFSQVLIMLACKDWTRRSNLIIGIWNVNFYCLFSYTLIKIKLWMKMDMEFLCVSLHNDLPIKN
jgi:hypothetical protein